MGNKLQRTRGLRSKHLAGLHPAKYVRLRRDASSGRPRLTRDDLQPHDLRKSRRRGGRLRRSDSRARPVDKRSETRFLKRSRSTTSAAPPTLCARPTIVFKAPTASSAWKSPVARPRYRGYRRCGQTPVENRRSPQCDDQDSRHAARGSGDRRGDRRGHQRQRHPHFLPRSLRGDRERLHRRLGTARSHAGSRSRASPR